MNNHTSVIAAVSTPPGKGGVAIIRISGAGSLEVAERVFIPRSKKKLSDIPARMQTFGDIIKDGETIDDGMATRFEAPASYTGEETVEISCHGGMLVTEAVLEAVLTAGAKHADAGEFTRRAFVNGKLSLTEAEAIGNLLSAESEDQIRLSSHASRSALSDRINSIRRTLVEILSSMYARIDYPDEDLGDFTDDEAIDMLIRAKREMEALSKTYKTGKAVSEGISTVICGKPNVGKSSIYNMLLGRDAAIVTDIKGTTRDILTDKLPLGRVMLSISDTAGIRDGDGIDPVERIGIERSLKGIDDAELIFAVFDASAPLDSEDSELISIIKGKRAARLAILNKKDIGSLIKKDELGDDAFDAVIEISAASEKEAATEAVRSVVERLFTDEKIKLGSDAVIFSARQNSSLTRALNLTRSALEAYKLGISPDAVSSDIERALGEIAELDGREVSEEVVSDIFSKFCVGK